MRYEGKLYRPPSEADALIVQATIGCSWNHCTYCDMYRDKVYRERELPAVLEDLQRSAGGAKPVFSNPRDKAAPSADAGNVPL